MFPFSIHLCFRNKTIFVYFSWKIIIFWTLLGIRENKRRKTKFLEVRPLFGLFRSKSAKIRPQIVKVSFFLFGLFKSCGQIFGQLKTLHEFADRQAQHPNVLIHFNDKLSKAKPLVN
jgi:hypothetical protein